MAKSICFIITQGELGGAQRYVFDLSASLKKDFQITVLIGAEKLELAARLEALGVNVKIIKHLRRNIHPLRDFLAIFELKKFLSKLKPDIVHLNSSKAGILGSLAARLAGIRNVIFTAHGFAFLEPHNFLVRQIYFWAEKFASLFRKKIITVSDFDRKEAVRMGLAPAEKFITIYNGIDVLSPPHEEGQGEVVEDLMRHTMTPLTSPLMRGEKEGGLGPHEGKKAVVIGTIAHLYPTKGIKYLIEAAHILNFRFKIADCRFIVIGEGPEKKNIESRISNLGLKDKFILLGAKPNAAQYLSNFDIFVLPSLKEGFPYTILEAARAGLPIVATAVGGIPEIITPHLTSPTGGEEIPLPSWEGQGEGACGILVPPKNPQALAEAIKFLIANPETAKLLGENAQAAIKKFTIEKMVNKTLRVYKSITNN